MGGKSIMKKIITLTVFLSSLLFSVSLSQAEIKKMVSEIKEERVGITLSTLEGTLNPFIIKEKRKSPEKVEAKELILAPAEKVYTLKAVLNHAAFINKKWYKTGDTLDNYKVGYVSSSSVTLKGSEGNKILSLEKKNKKFIKLNQGNR